MSIKGPKILKNRTFFADENEDRIIADCRDLVKEASNIRTQIRKIESDIRSHEREVERSKNSIRLLQSEISDENRDDIEQDIRDINDGLSSFQNLINREKQELVRLEDELDSLKNRYDINGCSRYMPLSF